MKDIEESARTGSASPLKLFAPEGGARPWVTPVPEQKLRPPRSGTRAGQLQFLKCLERNSFGEVWKVRLADGKFRLAQFLPPEVPEEALERLLFIHSHKGLVPLEVAWRDDGQALLITAYRAKTLQDRFRECWEKGSPGIPRAELLLHLRSAAETLDSLYQKFRLEHLNLNPRKLALHESGLQVGGFGLAELEWAGKEQLLSRLNPRYGAPELAGKTQSGKSDQFSLALIYAELVTGTHPLHKLRDQRLTETARPDLAMLSSGAQEILSKALACDPQDRHANVTELVRLLEAENQKQNGSGKRCLESLQPVIAFSPVSLGTSLPDNSLEQFVSELVLMAAGANQVREFRNVRYTLEPGPQMVHRCALYTYPGAAILRLEGFRQEWKATLHHLQDDFLLMRVPAPTSFWQQLLGCNVGLEIQLRFTGLASARRCEGQVLIKPLGCRAQRAARLLNDLGLPVLESLRTYLQAHPELRASERLPLNQPLRVCPVLGGVEVAEAIDCYSKDISTEGIGFFLPEPLTASQVYVNMPGSGDLAAFAGLAQVVRKLPRNDGWYEVGAWFGRPGKSFSGPR